MMPEDTGRNSDSPPEIAQNDAPPPRKEDVDSERTVESLKAENQRKADKIIALEKSMADKESRLEELEALEREGKLSKEDRREQSDLEDDLDKEADKLQNISGNKPWLRLTERLARRESERIAAENYTNVEIERGNDFIDDKAFDLEIPTKELIEKIKPFVKLAKGQSPYRRNVEAFREWQKEGKRVQSLEAREKAIAEKEDADRRFRETGSRTPRNNSDTRRWEEAKTPRQKQEVLVDLMDMIPATEK